MSNLLKKITKHKICDYMKCCNSYQLSPRELGSTKHSYSVFASELLKYDGRHFEAYHVNKIIKTKLKLIKLLKNEDDYELLIEQIRKN